MDPLYLCNELVDANSINTTTTSNKNIDLNHININNCSNHNKSFINKKSSLPKSIIRRSKSLHNSSQQQKASINGNHCNNKHLINTTSIKNDKTNQHDIEKHHEYSNYHYGYKRHFSNNDYYNHLNESQNNTNNINDDIIPSHWLINPRMVANSTTNVTASSSSSSFNQYHNHIHSKFNQTSSIENHSINNNKNNDQHHGSFSSEFSNISNNSSNNIKASHNNNYFQNQKSLKTKQEQQYDSRHFDLNRKLSGLSLSPNDNDNFEPILNSSNYNNHHNGLNRRDLLKWKSLLFNGDSDDDDDDEDDDLDLDDYDVDEENGDNDEVLFGEMENGDENDDETFDLLATTNNKTGEKNALKCYSNKMKKSFSSKMSDWQSYSQIRKKQLKFSYKFYMITQQKNYPPRYINNDNNSFMVKPKLIHRILVLGYPNSGKTSLIKEFKTFINQNPDCSFNPIDCDELNNQKNLLIHFLEMDSLDEYQLQTTVVNYQPDIYLILYSIESRDSFDDVKKILMELPKWDDVEEKVKIIVANKCDLERSRRITIKEARDFATKNDCKFIELSCALSHNINVLLQGIGAQIDLKKKQNLKREQGYKTSNEPSSKYSSTYATATNSKLKRRQSFFQKILRKVAINKSKSCNNLNVL